MAQRKKWTGLEAKLLDLSTKTDAGCWQWNGPGAGRGYGQTCWQGKRGYVHRLAWQMAHGAVPSGLFVCHHCDNRRCCNPDHLFLGTAQDNSSDMMAKGRHRAPGGSNPGERNAMAKLNEERVVYARQQWRAGRSYADIGAELGVSRAGAHLAISGATWGHVTAEPAVGPLRAKRAARA